MRRAQAETTSDGVKVAVHRTVKLTRSIGFLPGLCLSGLEPILGLDFQSVIYLDMAVPYGQASSQSMEFGHHWVVQKLLPDMFDKFPQFSSGIFASRATDS